MIDTKELAFALQSKYKIVWRQHNDLPVNVIDIEVWLTDWVMKYEEEQRRNTRLQELYAELASHCEGPEDGEYLIRDWRGYGIGVGMDVITDDIYQSYVNGRLDRQFPKEKHDRD